MKEIDTIILNGKLTRIDSTYNLDSGDSNHSMEINHTQVLDRMEYIAEKGVTIKEAMDYLKQFEEQRKARKGTQL